ncbi:MAG: AsmA family protein [Azospirillaceae bacterium]
MKKILIGLAVLLVILVAAVVAAPFLVPTDVVVDRVRQAVREQTGRELTVAGPVDLSVLPTLRVRLADVALANVEGGRAANLVELGELEAAVSITDLIGGTVSVERFVLVEPTIALEVDAEGNPNWVFAPAGSGAEAPAGDEGQGGGGFAPGEVRLGTMRLVDGRVSYFDARSGEELIFEDVDASVDMPTLDDRLRAEGSGRFQGEAVTLALDVAAPRALIDGGGSDLAVDIEAAPLTLAFDGAVATGAGPAADGSLTLEVPSIARLRAIAPTTVPVPDTPVDSVAFQGGVVAAPDRVALSGFELTADATTASGDLAVSLAGERPAVSGEIALSALDLDALMRDEAAAVEGEAAAESAPRAEGEAPPEAAADGESEAAALPEGAIDFSPLRLADIDLTIDLGGLTVEGTEIGPTTLVVSLQDGVLDAEVAEAAVFDGTIAGAVRVDSAAETPTIAVDTAIDGLSLGPPLAAFAGMPGAAGVLTLDLSVEGRGATRQDLADSLAGRATGRLTGGAFTLEDPQGGEPIALTGVDVSIDLPSVDGPLSATGQATVRGEVAQFDAMVAAPRALVAGHASDMDISLAAPAISLDFDGTAAIGDAPSAAGVLSLDVPSISGLAERAAVALPPDLPIDRFAVSGSVEASPTRVALSGGQIDADSLTASGDLRADLSGAVPSLYARLRTGPIDVDALTAPADAAPADGAGDGEQPAAESGAGEAAPTGPGGWSQAPIDLSGLRAADVDAVVEAAGITVDGIAIGPTTVTLRLQDGVLDLSVPDAPVFDGRVGLDLGIDSTAGPPAYDIAANVRGVQIEPVLRHFAETDRLSGTTEATIDVTARGASQAEIVRALNGNAAVVLRDGALKGVNIAEMVRNIGSAFTNSDSGEARTTDFAEFGGTFAITDGVARSEDLRMLAPLFRIEGRGQTAIPERSLDFRVEPRAVATIEGQGGQFEETGVRVPILIGGTWSEPRFAPDLEGLIRGTLENPEALRDQIENLREGGGAEDVLRGLLGDGASGLLGGGGDSTTGTESAPAAEDTAPADGGSTTEESAPTEETAPTEAPAPEQATPDQLREQLEQDPVGTIRNLFGN